MLKLTAVSRRVTGLAAALAALLLPGRPGAGPARMSLEDVPQPAALPEDGDDRLIHDRAAPR